MMMVEMVRRGARQHGPRTAVRHGDQHLTFTQVDQLASRIANALLGIGVAQEQRVALLLNNGLYTLPIDFAFLKARLVRVPLNSRLSAPEHARMLAETGTRLLIYGPGLGERAAELRELAGSDLAMLSVGAGNTGDRDLVELAASAADTDPMLPSSPDDVVLALFTSGTTGTLKASQHTQASWAAVGTNILTNLVSPRPGDAMLHAASLIHASGTFIMPFWVRGGCAVVLEGFDPERYVGQIVDGGATHVNLVPTMISMLTSSGKLAGGVPGRLRTVVYGASPMPRPVIEKALEQWGPIFTQYYGQTEAPLALTVLAPEDHVGPDAVLGACGMPSLDVDLRLIGEDGSEVPRGEVGEIAVRGPMVHAGYLDAPELNAQATRQSAGHLRTRDLGRLDERGYLHLVDRTSDMIVTGGYNVYPKEVEDALLSHPAILECAVVGAPDPKWVEAVTAFVVVRPEFRGSDVELTEWVRARLAGYKVPKRIERIEVIPKSAVGKILRRALRAPLWNR